MYIFNPVGSALTLILLLPYENNTLPTDPDDSGDCEQMFRIACRVEELWVTA
jgi:hypothetical protein